MGEKEKVEGIITAIYKLNLHCHQCWRDIKKPLSITQGKIIFRFLFLKSMFLPRY